MRLLLDTHIALALISDGLNRLPKAVAHMLTRGDDELAVSVVTLWEIAIKHRLGKLPLAGALPEVEGQLKAATVSILPLYSDHAIAEALPTPQTRDPFDRLLLAIAELEGMKLVTIDRALAAHPLAWRPPAA